MAYLADLRKITKRIIHQELSIWFFFPLAKNKQQQSVYVNRIIFTIDAQNIPSWFAFKKFLLSTPIFFLSILCRLNENDYRFKSLQFSSVPVTTKFIFWDCYMLSYGSMLTFQNTARRAHKLAVYSNIELFHIRNSTYAIWDFTI